VLHCLFDPGGPEIRALARLGSAPISLPQLRTDASEIPSLSGEDHSTRGTDDRETGAAEHPPHEEPRRKGEGVGGGESPAGGDGLIGSRVRADGDEGGDRS
jgi:hypothetical protein